MNYICINHGDQKFFQFVMIIKKRSTEDIDTCCETVIKLINDINDKLPRLSCKTGTKLYWSKELNDHAKNKKKRGGNGLQLENRVILIK